MTARRVTNAAVIGLAMGLAWTSSVDADTGLVVGTEAIAGSDIPVTYHLVPTVDGLFTAIGLRKPRGRGPFPVVVFASGNGGEGLAWVKDASRDMSWTQERFLDAGYAVAWMRYRAEVDVPAYDGRELSDRAWSGRPRLSRAPFEYEDVIAILEYVAALPDIQSDNVGYMGMSHGGEMLMKIASVYPGLRAGIASEPASATFLARRPADPDAPERPETVNINTPEMQARAVRELHARIDRKVAMQRIAPIDIPIFVQGRDRDHNQDTFRVNYELLSEAGKDVQWKSYDHDEHGFVYVKRNANGHYEPDAIQREAVADSIAFFDRHMKR